MTTERELLDRMAAYIDTAHLRNDWSDVRKQLLDDYHALPSSPDEKSAQAADNYWRSKLAEVCNAIGMDPYAWNRTDPYTTDEIIQHFFNEFPTPVTAQAATAVNTAEGELHEETEKLVRDFAAALREKLAAAEKKYGYSDGWQEPDWMDECREHLRKHVEKGDPRDVAAYCAFLWYHGESTASPPASASMSAGVASVLRSKLDDCEQALAASQRRVEALEAANAELCTFMDDPLKVLTALRARLAAAEALYEATCAYYRKRTARGPFARVEEGAALRNAIERYAALSANGEAAG